MKQKNKLGKNGNILSYRVLDYSDALYINVKSSKSYYVLGVKCMVEVLNEY